MMQIYIMKKYLSVFLLSLITSTASANTSEQEKTVRNLSNYGGLNYSDKGAINVASMAFTQSCNRNMTVAELNSISASAEFAELKSKMQDGKAVGVNKAKFILYEKINKLCKKRK
ncbi:hypothetical protein [Xenorhabdus bovienii]|uniref:hypothetical protein n=1 Tax=Xenorhabdus bovienii TaxID=40576 RepID=UPI0023B2D8E4|nr:hypothetical protein [Xenorhabdus bovienii]MDE9429877.1 hypothetical protein [Xenorhabdus bovienii]MDE9487532.1 hypothetical protein [Xenorhabdus bovienii]